MSMLLLKKHAKSKCGDIPEFPNRIISKWVRTKKRIAFYLQQKSELLSMRAKKLSLSLFCFLFGGISLYIIIQSAAVDQKVMPVQRISRPVEPGNSENLLQADSVITKMEYERIERFKNYLIQLQEDSASAKKFDSVMKVRPQLLDSIKMIERIYLSQK